MAITAVSPLKDEAPVPRLLSLDRLRGLDVLLMLFVNEVAGVSGAPAFLLHAPRGEGMTITDVVFPAFLFIVGMAVPFALDARRRRARSPGEVWRHVLTRTASLLALGVLMVNAERASPQAPLPPALWNVLMTLGVILAWQGPGPQRRSRILRVIGIALLVVLVFLYRGTDLTGLFQIRPYWWGILGLIGWAYLLVAALYLAAGDRPAVLTGVMGLLYCLYLAAEVGQVGWLVAVKPVVSVGTTLGSHGAVVLAGTILALLWARGRREGASPARVRVQALAYAAGLAAAGGLLYTLHGLHPAFRISKLGATPPWCLFSSALTAAAWAAVDALSERVRRWPASVQMASDGALLAYLMAPLLLSLFTLAASAFGTRNFYEVLAGDTAVGLVRSAVFAWLVVRLCGLLHRRGIRLQL
jgi:heparan-alpha-glucosaminide N-acetyltransferase